MWSCVLPAGKVAAEHPLPRGEEEGTAVESRETSPDGDTDTEVNSYTGTCGSLFISLHHSQRLMCPSRGHILCPAQLEAKQSHSCLWCGAAQGLSEHCTPPPHSQSKVLRGKMMHSGTRPCWGPEVPRLAVASHGDHFQGVKLPVGCRVRPVSGSGRCWSSA